MKKVFSFSAIGGIVGLVLFLVPLVKAYFEESNSIIIQTYPVGSCYLYCQEQGVDFITLGWSCPSPVPDEILINKDSEILWQCGGSSGINCISFGSTTTSGLDSDTEYNFTLTWRYGTYSSSTSVNCKTQKEAEREVSWYRKIVPLGPDRLYLTWQDLETRPHTFLVERIKVTPSPTYDLTATTLSYGQVKLTWKNDTSIQELKSPIYHKIIVIKEDGGSRQVTQVITKVLKNKFNEDFDVSYDRYKNYIKTGINVCEEPSKAESECKEYEYTIENLDSGNYTFEVSACSFIKPVLDGSITTICGLPATTSLSISSYFESDSNFISFIKNLFKKLVALIKKAFAEYEKTVIETITIDESELDEYFSQFQRAGTSGHGADVVNSLNLSVFEDAGLEPETVYLYRIKTIYLDDNSDKKLGTVAGKTLPSASSFASTSIKVCLRNSLCGEKTVSYPSGSSPPLSQCMTNADCRNVGSSRQVFEEAR